MKILKSLFFGFILLFPSISLVFAQNTNGALQVSSAEQISNTEIELKMSKPVKPISIPEAFIIENLNTYQSEDIISVVSEEDIIKITIDGEFESDNEYKITATSIVTDINGNPVASGITDNVDFVAQDMSSPPEEAVHESAPLDTTPPIDATNLWADISRVKENVVFLQWKKSQDNDVADQILYHRIDDGDWDSGYSIGKDLESFEFYTEPNRDYEIKLVTMDTAGNESAGVMTQFSTVVETSPPKKPQDSMAPVDVTNFKFDTNLLESTESVKLTWTKSLDTDQDVIDQILYVKKGMEPWEEVQKLGKSTETFLLPVEIDQNYQAKIVTMDRQGNKSPGVVIEFATTITETGPGGWVVALMVISLVTGFGFLKNQKQVC